MIMTSEQDAKVIERVASSSLIISKRKHDANTTSEAYEYAALAQNDRDLAQKYAQKAVITAPWRLNAWQALTLS